MNYFSALSSFVLALCFLSFQARAAKCLIQEAMTDPRLANNSQFWVEYSQLAARGEVPQRDLLALARRHNPNFASEASASAVSSTLTRSPIQTLRHHRRAEYEIEKLQPNIRRRYNTFLETIQGPEGVQAFYRNPGSWHMERLPQFGPNAYSVRLNGDVRVLFDLDGSNVLVREVNRERIHNR